jgi:hypothetical protein
VIFLCHQLCEHAWPFCSPDIDVWFPSLGLHEGETVQGNLNHQLNWEPWSCQCVTLTCVCLVPCAGRLQNIMTTFCNKKKFRFCAWAFNDCKKFRFCIMLRYMNILCTDLQPGIEITPISINISNRLLHHGTIADLISHFTCVKLRISFLGKGF